MNTTATTSIAIMGRGSSAKLMRYHRFQRTGNQCIIMPKTKSANTLQYPKQISGITSTFHAEPIWCTMSFAVFQACSLADAGSRLEPERKNNRVKLINIKV